MFTKNIKRKSLIAVLALIAIAAVFLAVYLISAQQPVQGSKALTVTVIHGDQTEKVFDIRTDAEYLRGALDEQGLIEGEEGAFGLFITTVDGETADSSLEQWWCITKGGEMLMTGAETTPILDGESYELELITGY